MSVHDKMKNQCFVCGEDFNTKDNILKHVQKKWKVPSKSGNGDQSHNCQHCKEVFKYKKSTVEHIENSHKEVNIKYLCKVCGDKFNNIELLLKHSEKNHEKNSIFTCEECNFIINNICPIINKNIIQMYNL